MLKSTIKHKNVEFTELFYDLVFVYAISKTTELIHHLHGGVVGGEAFFAFIMTTFVLVDAWMLQTVFTNQYGKNSFLNLSIMFVKMMILLVFAGMIVEDWHDHFDYLCWTIASLSFVLFVQYFAQYYSHGLPWLPRCDGGESVRYACGEPLPDSDRHLHISSDDYRDVPYADLFQKEV